MAANAKSTVAVRALVQFDVDPENDESPGVKDITGLQDAFFSFLEKKPGAMVEPFQRFRSRPFMSLELTREDLDRLEANGSQILFEGRPVRVRVEPTPTLEPSAALPLGSTPASELLEALGDGELTESGDGAVIVVIDSGVDPSSGALHAKVVDGSQVVSASPTCEIFVERDDPTLGAGGSTEPTKPSHGTRVAGLSSYVASGVTLVSIRVGDDDGALATDVIAALQEVACRWSTEHPVVAAVVLTLTSPDVRDPDFPSHRELMEKAILELEAMDIPVVISAGNDSFTGELAFPADLEASVSVGGLGRDLGKRMTASNWDASLDLCAPAAAVGLPVDWMETPLFIGGTSYSPPFVAGVLARFRQRYRGGKVFEDFLPVLRETGVPITVEKDGVAITVPRLDIGAAMAVLDAIFLSSEDASEIASDSVTELVVDSGEDDCSCAEDCACCDDCACCSD